MNTNKHTKYTLAGLGLTMGLAIAAAAAPALAAPTTPEPISAQVTKATSASRQTTSEVTVEGTWATPRLTVGSTLTVGSVDGGFAWKAGFPFTLDDGSKIGECVADQAQLTCTVTEVPEAWAAKQDVSGTFHARAQLTDKAVGTESTQITLNGETVRTLVWGDKDGTGTCSNDCTSPAHFEYARPETVKYGWTDANGAIAWGIQWKVDPGTEYTITDETNALHAAVKCSTGPTWDPKTTSWTDGKLDETKHTLTFTPPVGALVCVTFPDATKPVEGQTTYTNKATINGQSFEATATIKASGGTDGDGTVKPTPAPAPTPTTEPTPEPTEPTVNPSEKPNTSPTPAPKPSDEPQSAPTPDPTPEPRVTTEPVPVPTQATPKPEPKADAQPAPAPTERLAKTGATLDGIGIAVLSFLIGAALVAAGYGINRRYLGGNGR